MSPDSCAQLIQDRIDSAQPFSLIRLGDGEGVLLSICNGAQDRDMDYLAEHLGPKASTLSALVAIKERMVNAIESADVIGVRDDIVDVEFDSRYINLPEDIFLEKFRSSFKLREVDRTLPYPGSRRISLLYSSLQNFSMSSQARFCSSWVHYDLHLSGYIFRALRGQRRIGLISTREGLCTELEDLFGISVSYWKIPDMYRDIKPDQRPDDYIEQLERVMHRKLVEFPGMLFLVGGGLYGKLYCSFIRQQGGIALDVGSLLDAWLGMHTRPAVYKTLFNKAYDNGKSPDRLQLSAMNVEALVN